MPQGRQIINGREYAYNYISVWNKEKQRSEQKRDYIGRIVDGIFCPNKKYLLQQELSGVIAKNEPESGKITGCKRLFVGATYLLDQVGILTGIQEDLKICFPRIYREIQSLAYYLVLEPDSPLYRFNHWAQSHAHPFGMDIASQRSSELLSQINEDGKMEFFRRQVNRRCETEYLFYDTTSVSSYSHRLKQVKYGKNKDGDSLPQVNIALLVGQQSSLPAWYRKLPGNIPDVMTVKNMLASIDYIDFNKIKFVMDRGFYSAKNIDNLLTNDYNFIIGTKMGLKYIQKAIEAEYGDFDTWERYDENFSLFTITKSMNWIYNKMNPENGDIIKEKKQIYLHVYYDDQKATDDKVKLYSELNNMMDDIRKGNMGRERTKECHKYFEFIDEPGEGLSIKPKQEAINKKRNDFGFFVLISSDDNDRIRVLRTYRSKDMVEKSFYDLKQRLNMRRPSVSSEENLEGKLFIQFIGLIYTSWVKRAMDEAELFKNNTMQQLFDSLDVIEKFWQPGGKSYYGEITSHQEKLYKKMGVLPPA
jgi:transposase